MTEEHPVQVPAANISLNIKQAAALLSAFTGVCAFMIFIWTEMLVPKVISQAGVLAREEAERAVTSHEAHGPHAGAARQEDIDRLERTMSSLATKSDLEVINQKLLAIKERLDRQEREKYDE